MKKSIKIVGMADFHNSPTKSTGKSSATRRGLVQGTLDIVTPRSPIQSCESVPISSPVSLISSKNSYMEDAHATPRRDHPKISTYEEPLPERPSTSLELSDEETEACEPNPPVKEKKNCVPLVDGRRSRGAVEVSLSFGSSQPAAKVQRHPVEAGARPFGDASNLPIRGETINSPVPTTRSQETQASPHLGHFGRSSGEENRKVKEVDDSFSKSGIPSPKIYNKLSSGDFPSLTFRDTQSSPSLGFAESPNLSEIEKTKKTKKKKAGRVVESRFLKPSASSTNAASLSMSLSVGRPLLNSTALDSTARASITSSAPASKSKRAPTSADPRLSSPATLSTRRLQCKKPIPGSREKPPEKEKEKEKEKTPVVATPPAKKGITCTPQELELLHTVYLQYAYLNALTEQHSKRQDEQFQAEFGVLCDAYRERQEKLVVLRKELLYWRSVHALEDSITSQISALEPLLALFPEFGTRFTGLAEALDRSRQRLALRDLVLPSEEQLNSWQAELATEASRSADILNQVLCEAPLSVGHLESLSDIVEQLLALKAQHQQLFEVARDIISRAEALFAEESSLLIHEKQEQDSAKVA